MSPAAAEKEDSMAACFTQRHHLNKHLRLMPVFDFERRDGLVLRFSVVRICSACYISFTNLPCYELIYKESPCESYVSSFHSFLYSLA
jgi:hypothetical protein